MIGDAIGWRLDRIVDDVAPKIAEQAVASDLLSVETGQVCGIDPDRRGLRERRAPHQPPAGGVLGAPDPYDSVLIEGSPRLYSKIAGGVHGDIATASITVNSIPAVLTAAPGLRTMRDMQLPSFFSGTSGPAFLGAEALREGVRRPFRLSPAAPPSVQTLRGWLSARARSCARCVRGSHRSGSRTSPRGGSDRAGTAFRFHRYPSLAGQFDLQLDSTAVRGLVVASTRQPPAFSSWMRTFRVVASMRRPSKGPASGRPKERSPQSSLASPLMTAASSSGGRSSRRSMARSMRWRVSRFRRTNLTRTYGNPTSGGFRTGRPSSLRRAGRSGAFPPGPMVPKLSSTRQPST